MQEKITKTHYGRYFLLLCIMIFASLFLLIPATEVKADESEYWDEFVVEVRDAELGPQMRGQRNDSSDSIPKLLDNYKGLISGIAAIGAVTMVLYFIVQFFRLGASGDNPKARAEALKGCLWTGLAAAGLGAAALIAGLFYKMSASG